MKSLRKFAQDSPEIKFYEQQNVIDKARVKDLRKLKQKNRLESIRESNENLTKEIDEFTQEMDSDDITEFQHNSIIEKSEKSKKEPIEFTLLRTSVMAALSSDEEESEFEIEEEEEEAERKSGISEKTEGNLKSQNSTNKSMTNYGNGYSMSKSMKYDELMSTFVSAHDDKEVQQVIDASDRARDKLYSPYLIKNNYRPTLPTNLSYLRNYRTPQNSKSYTRSKLKNAESSRKNYANYSEQNVIDSITTNSKSVYDIDGVQNHIARLRRAHLLKKEPVEEYEPVEVIIPNKPLLTPSKAEITRIIDTEMDYVLAENSV